MSKMNDKSIDLMTGQEIPAGLADLGVAVGWQPVPLNRSRLLLAGHPGTAKSSLLHNNPKAVVLDIEGGGRTVLEPRAVRWPNWKNIEDDRAAGKVVPSPCFEDFRAFTRKVIERKVAGKLPEVEMIGIDGFDAILDLWKRDACKEFKIENINDYRGGYGKGYDLGCETLFGLLDEIYRAGMGWCLLIHLVDRTIKVGNTDVTQTSLAVPEKFQGHLGRVVEHVLFLDHDTETVIPQNETKLPDGRTITTPGLPVVTSVRRVSCTPGTTLRGTQSNDPKVRVPMVPTFLLPKQNSWAKLEAEYNAALTRMTTV